MGAGPPVHRSGGDAVPHVIAWSLTLAVVGGFLLATAPPAADAGDLEVVFFDDVEAGSPSALGQWTGGSDNGTTWERGTPVPPGPAGAYSPTNAWGTNIGGDYTSNVSQLFLISPQIDLRGAASATLTFAHWYEVENGSDGGTVLVRNVTGADTDWHLAIPEGGYPMHSVVSLNVPGVGVRLPGFSATGASPDWTIVNLSLEPFVENVVRSGSSSRATTTSTPMTRAGT